MDYDTLQTVIQPEVLILIPVLYVVGLIIRQTPNLPDWIDAWVKLVIAIVACIFIVGFNVDAFLQGILVAGAASLVKDLADRTITGVQVQRLNEKSNDPHDLE